jgi:hypothetical protein
MTTNPDMPTEARTRHVPCSNPAWETCPLGGRNARGRYSPSGSEYVLEEECKANGNARLLRRQRANIPKC